MVFITIKYHYRPLWALNSLSLSYPGFNVALIQMPVLDLICGTKHTKWIANLLYARSANTDQTPNLKIRYIIT